MKLIAVALAAVASAVPSKWPKQSCRSSQRNCETFPGIGFSGGRKCDPTFGISFQTEYSFCNFDDTTTGDCETCPDESKSCRTGSLQEAEGVVDCLNCCFDLDAPYPDEQSAGCKDDPRWYARINGQDRGCEYLASAQQNCGTKSLMGISGTDACPTACDSCRTPKPVAKSTPRPTPKPRPSKDEVEEICETVPKDICKKHKCCDWKDGECEAEKNVDECDWDDLKPTREQVDEYCEDIPTQKCNRERCCEKKGKDCTSENKIGECTYADFTFEEPEETPRPTPKPTKQPARAPTQKPVKKPTPQPILNPPKCRDLSRSEWTYWGGDKGWLDCQHIEDSKYEEDPDKVRKKRCAREGTKGMFGYEACPVACRDPSCLGMRMDAVSDAEGGKVYQKSFNMTFIALAALGGLVLVATATVLGRKVSTLRRPRYPLEDKTAKEPLISSHNSIAYTL